MTSAKTAVILWIVEDNRDLRESLIQSLTGQRGTWTVRGFPSCESALGQPAAGGPYVVLMDIGLPGMSGLEGIGAIRERWPACEVVVFTVFDEAEKIYAAICAGASGYLLKSEPTGSVIAAVEEVLRGGSPMHPQVARKIMDRLSGRRRPAPDTQLSEREHDVLRLMAEGMTKKETLPNLRSASTRWTTICGAFTASSTSTPCTARWRRRCATGCCDAMSWHDNRAEAGHADRMRLLLLPLLIPAPAALAAPPDFERDVAPILEARCLSCHNEHLAKGDLRLDLREHALSVIAPGRPEKSPLIEQISGPEPEMPKKGAPLSADQVRTLREWVAAGASWPQERVLKDNPSRNLDWWSLKPIAGAKPPATGHPVDGFLAARLADHKLSPMPSADAPTLLRRITFDLTGLPPTPAELDAFTLADYERTVDRLLASPAFGEKWARHWLDVARYGETHGYDKDKPRLNAWPYRDYVIRAFNEDKPYDRFVQEQIAGDALFPGERDGVVGLGFLAAGPWDFIGHSEVGEAKVDGRIAKHLDRDEMIAAVFNVFVSTTAQCAQCHHHKFDPVKTEDYYRLHAVFAAIDRADRVYAGLPPETERERNEIVARINSLRSEKDRLDTGLNRAIAGRTSGLDRRITELKKKHGAPSRPQYGWHSRADKTPDAVKWVQVDLGAAKPLDHLRVVPAFDTFGGIGAGFGFPLRYKIESADDADFQSGVRLLRDATGEDQPNPKNREVVVDVGGEAVRFIRITATRLAPRKDDFIFALGELEAIGGEKQENLALSASVTSTDSIEQAPRWGRANLTDGIYHRELGDPQALAELRKLEDERAAIEAEMRSPETTARLKAIAAELPMLEKQLGAFPQGELVYAAATDFAAQSRFSATAGKPRPIHLLNRGDIRQPGDALHAGMPPLWPGAVAEFALPADAPESAARAALAGAISHRENPLLWRSIVNRLWHWTFGKAIVGSPNDFGRMGMKPTHPRIARFSRRTSARRSAALAKGDRPPAGDERGLPPREHLRCRPDDARCRQRLPLAGESPPAHGRGAARCNARGQRETAPRRPGRAEFPGLRHREAAALAALSVSPAQPG
jgi:DNA-binding NarL/FixJ family response regulator